MENKDKKVVISNSQNPLVSIGLPVFNGLQKKNEYSTDISKTLKSILNQTYQNIEVIISDNCSTDDTANIIKEIIANDKRVKFFQQIKPLGPGENFTFVLNKAKGKYFKWNCHDDFISENFIEENLKFLEENKNFIFCSSPSCYDFEYQEKRNIVKFDFESSLFRRIRQFHQIRSKCLSMVYGLIKKEYLLKTTEFTKDYLAIDWIVVLELLFQGKFKTIDEGLIVIGSSGRSADKDHLKRSHYFNKFIYYFLPYFELNKVCVKKSLNSKELSILEKFFLIFTTLKINLAYMYFYKIKKKR